LPCLEGRWNGVRADTDVNCRPLCFSFSTEDEDDVTTPWYTVDHCQETCFKEYCRLRGRSKHSAIGFATFTLFRYMHHRCGCIESTDRTALRPLTSISADKTTRRFKVFNHGRLDRGSITAIIGTPALPLHSAPRPQHLPLTLTPLLAPDFSQRPRPMNCSRSVCLNCSQNKIVF
jgi:hypothetical protein